MNKPAPASDAPLRFARAKRISPAARLIAAVPFLQRRVWTIVFSTIAMASVGAVSLTLLPAQQVATATILVKPGSGDAKLKEQLTTLKSPAFMSELAKRTDWRAQTGEEPNRIGNAIAVKRRGASRVIEVKATTPNSDLAVRMANGLTDIYLENLVTGEYAPAENVQGEAIAAGRLDAAVRAVPAPSPIGAPLLWIALAALAAGISIGALVDYRDRGVRNAKDALKKTGVRVLSFAPSSNAKSAPDVDITAYRELRAELRRDKAKSKIICLTEVRHDDGATAGALALARAGAAAGERVLLIDCDLRGRSLTQALGQNPKLGFLDVALGECKWEDAIIRDCAPGVHLLPAAESFFPPRDIFNALAADKLLTDLRPSYDLIILDAPPALTSQDALAAARLADQTVVAQRWKKTSASAARQTIEELQNTGSNVVGLLMTDVAPAMETKLQRQRLL